MIKLNQKQLEWIKDYASECGSCEKNHVRHSTFHTVFTLYISDNVLSDSVEDGVALPNELLDKLAVVTGTWSEEDGHELSGDVVFYTLENITNPEYIMLMTCAQDCVPLQDFIKEHCEEFITKQVPCQVVFE
ncbi:hypothetical protein LC177_00770 [Escherichia coli]